MTNNSAQSLDSLIPELGTGDLIFFQGTARDSVLIRELTGGEWSHCAMIVRAEDIDESRSGLLLFESSIVPGEDIQDSEGQQAAKAGVMLVDFEARMSSYANSGNYSAFAVRKLKPTAVGKLDLLQLKSFIKNPHIRQSGYPAEHAVAAEHFLARELESESFTSKALGKIRRELGNEIPGSLSDSNIRAMIGKTVESVRDGFDQPIRDKINHDHSSVSHYFCSELVVDALMHAGVLALRNAAGFSPSDLSLDDDEQIAASYGNLIALPVDLGRG